MIVTVILPALLRFLFVVLSQSHGLEAALKLLIFPSAGVPGVCPHAQLLFRFLVAFVLNI